MTKKEALTQFNSLYPREDFMRTWTNGKRSIDDIALREAWSEFTDSLCKKGKITLRQYESWTNPF